MAIFTAVYDCSEKKREEKSDRGKIESLPERHDIRITLGVTGRGGEKEKERKARKMEIVKTDGESRWVVDIVP